MENQRRPTGALTLLPERLHTRLAVVASLLVGLPALADPSNFALPLDLGQGLLFPTASASTAYRFQPGIAPSLGLGPVRLGIPLAVSFTDPQFRAGTGPHWRSGIGGRASLRLHSFLGFSDLAVWAKAEALVWIPDRQESIGIGLEAEVLSVRIGVAVNKLYGSDERFGLLTSIGVELHSLYRLLSGPRPTVRNEIRPTAPEPDAARLLASQVKSRVLGLGSTAVFCWVGAHVNKIASVTTLDGLVALATSDGQTSVADAIREGERAVPGDQGDPLRARAAGQGLLEAYADAVQEINLTCH